MNPRILVPAGILLVCAVLAAVKFLPPREVHPEMVRLLANEINPGTVLANVTAQAPDQVSGLTVWMSADSLKGLKEGASVDELKNRASTDLPLTAYAPGQGPKFRATAANGLPSIHFSGEDDQLESDEIKGSAILDDDAATVLIVMRQDKGERLNDVFGWGNCDRNRFLAHSKDGEFNFQMGAPPESSLVGREPSASARKFFLMTAIRDLDRAALLLNDELVGSASGFALELDTGESAVFQLGNGPCKNSFKGDIAEIVVYDRALPPQELFPVIRHLMSKYKLAP